MINIENLILKLRTSFADEAVKKSVVDEKWLRKNNESGIDSTGFCFAASEVIYRLCGGKDKWKVMSISSKDWEFGSHYYLQDRNSGEILDITSDQYTEKGLTIPYQLGKGKSFRAVSRKAKNLAKAIGADLP